MDIQLRDASDLVVATILRFFEAKGYSELVLEIDPYSQLPQLKWASESGHVNVIPKVYAQGSPVDYEYEFSFTRLSEGDTHFESVACKLSFIDGEWRADVGNGRSFVVIESFLEDLYQSAQPLNR